MLRSILGEPLTIFGDGLQVRDALHVSDAAEAWIAVLENISSVRGRVFNLGGGPANAISLLELIDQIAIMRGVPPVLSFDAWRPGDQPWYVSGCDALSSAVGWKPQIPLREGLPSLLEWLEGRFAPTGATMPKELRI
jgi:CDP-paratose 2-epimerase